MTLRSKFILLVLGSLVVPVLAMAAAVFFFQIMGGNEPDAVMGEFETSLSQVKSAEDFAALSEDYGDSYFMLMIEENRIVGTTPQLSDDSFRPQIIMNQYSLQLEDGRQVEVIFGLDFLKVNRGIMPVAFLIISLIVLTVMSLLIIRSINNSITRLEETTRHIAQGNLDVVIDGEGKDKFGSLARSLDTMRDQIKLEYDRRNRFFMGVSHDLKTPLASITGYADALLEGMADNREAMKKYLGIIKDKSYQLEEGITRLIHYLKLSNYDFQANLEEKSLFGFLNDFLDVQSEEAGFLGNYLEGSIEIKNDLLIPFDAELLRRALENLLQNAYRYGREKEPVKFSCHKDYDNVVIAVENQGARIPEEQLKLLFEPFYRGDQSRRSEGFGLGLASVKSIVESHDWTISVESSDARTRFSIIIPPDKLR